MGTAGSAGSGGSIDDAGTDVFSAPGANVTSYARTLGFSAMTFMVALAAPLSLFLSCATA